MKPTLTLFAISLAALWLTPDQQGQRFFRQGQFKQAAEAFRDPQWKGAAWFRAGEFEKAVQEFSRSPTAEARYNEGNAWVMLGKYEQAIASYDRAFKQRPDWNEARENRDLAAARAKLIQQTGGDLGDQRLGADEIVFDKNKQPGGQDTEVAGEQAMSAASIQAIWLRQVQTKPADFLKAKFAYQQQLQQDGEVSE